MLFPAQHVLSKHFFKEDAQTPPPSKVSSSLLRPPPAECSCVSKFDQQK